MQHSFHTGTPPRPSTRRATPPASRLTGYLLAALVALAVAPVQAQPESPPRKPLDLNVNQIRWQLSTQMGDGGMASQFSWNLTARKEESEAFFFPQDRYLSNMLIHLYNVINYSDEGYVGLDGTRHERVWERLGVTTDYAWERRRYRPPIVSVDGREQTPPYTWEVDPDATADYVAQFEDVHRNKEVGYGGFRSKVKLYAFSNPNHDDYVIWDETRVFTGESVLPREVEGETLQAEHYLPNQDVRVWWAFTPVFAPTKGGEGEMWGYYLFEGQDDKDHFFRRTSDLVTSRARKDLTVAYYWDAATDQARPYEIKDENGELLRTSEDDTGDPNRVTGALTATQIPGFTVLYADKSATEHEDDPAQPWAAPHANIVENFFGQRYNFDQRDVYAGLNSRFPGAPIKPEKGTMRALTVGPYDLTLERDGDLNPVRTDSFRVVYAIGVGDVGYAVADSLGRRWLRGEIDDAGKNVFVDWGKDSLFQTLDRAYWAFANGYNVPDPPPPPDVEVTSGPDQIEVAWSYPEPAYFLDPDTGTDDFGGWRVYRKKGGAYVNDPRDSDQGFDWEPVFETTDRTTTTFADDNVERGVAYYYAVTAFDDGSQNTFGLNPGESLESSRMVNRSLVPAVAFKPGLDVSDQARVVPNPYTVAGGRLNFPGQPDQLLFANLPFRATLSIYTETGELVKRIDHSGSADERWNQRTDDNQLIASGLYILAIHDAATASGESLPTQYVKFVVVR